MQTTTTLQRWLGIFVLTLGLASVAHAQRTVTLRLNTATLPDTVAAEDTMQVRGCLSGCENDQSELPGGEVIAWNDNTTLIPDNVEGDYWETTFQIPEDQALQFKFFSQLAAENGIGGWEDGGNHEIPGGTGDTTLTLHYFEKGDDQAYAWKPWAEKEDSIAVHFRVYMATEQAVNKGFVAGENGSGVSVRGAPLDGASPLDWGDATGVVLANESSDNETAGHYLYSGVGYYPESAAGTEQGYKFFVQGEGDTGYEEPASMGGGNRTFTIPAQDTTLHWKYFGDAAPTDDVPTESPQETHDVIFTTDISPLENAGVFSTARGDTIIVRGSFNGWGNCLEAGNPDACQLFETLEGTFSSAIPVEAVPNSPVGYKFFVDFETDALTGDEGFEEPLDYGGGDRQFVFSGEDNQDLGTQFFNNIRSGNVIPEGEEIEVTFQVDMTPADTFATPFDPSQDTVQVAFEDVLWIYTQSQAKDVETEAVNTVNLSDEDGDGIYTGTYTVVGPTYNGIGYRYRYGTPSQDSFTTPGGGGLGSAGRRRYQYVLPGEEGTYPEEYTLPVIEISSDDALPFACNPTADVSTLPQDVQDLCYEAGTSPTSVEPVSGSAPQQVTLGANYPNPFSRTTTFTYRLDRAQHVAVRVYDVMGREVARLVDRRQSAGTYRVNFEAEGLSSGLYLYQLETPTKVVSKQMTLVR